MLPRAFLRSAVLWVKTWKPYPGKLLYQLPTLLPTLHTSSCFVIFSVDMLATFGDTGKVLLPV